MNNRTSPLRVTGTSLVSSVISRPIRPYIYGGDQPFIPGPVVEAALCDECEAPATAVGLCGVHYSRYRRALKKDPSIRRPPTPPKTAIGFRDDACGTPRGYSRHRYYGLPPCDPCHESHLEYRKERKAIKARELAA